jgi:hypothetical protein
VWEGRSREALPYPACFTFMKKDVDGRD